MKSLIGPVVLSLLVVACGKGGEASGVVQGGTSKPTASLGQAANGSDFTMEVPKEWLVVELDGKDVAAVEKKMKGTEFEPSFVNIKGMIGNEMFKLFAFIPEFSTSAHKSNLNVISMASPGAAKAVLDANEEQLKGVDAKLAVLSNFTTVPESRVFAWMMGEVKTLSLVSVQNGRQYVITVSLPKTVDEAKARAAAKDVFNSFKVK